MKLTLCGDFHITEKRPESRKDDYFQSILQKLQYIIHTSIKEKSSIILQPGDFFDRPSVPYSLTATIISFLRESQVTWYVIAGQHDLKFRNKGNTALDVLISAEIVKTSKQTSLSESVFLYSCSFDEEIPEIETEGFNILMIHKMIVEEKLWEGQVEYEWANTILRRTNFSLIVSGDNHKSFFIDYKGMRTRTLINCGSLMRSTRDQMDHKPCFVIYDTDKREYKVHYIPVKPAFEVFDMARIEVEKERDEKLAAFVDGLKWIGPERRSVHFALRLAKCLNENKISKRIIDIINDAQIERE